MFKFAKISCCIMILLFLHACSSTTDEGKNPGEGPRINEAVNKNDQIILEKATTAGQLPFADFKERWNAVSDEQMTNLYIKNLETATNDKGTYYYSRINPQNELRIFVENDFVQQLELITEGKAKSTTISMLTGWSQIINILHPNMEINDVDEFFHKVGVGPNADLSNIKATTFSYYDLNYEIYPSENGYSFIAAYAKPQ